MSSQQQQWESFLHQEFMGLTVERNHLTPSQWAETRRYLPQSVTPTPGFYSFSVTPYLREILDCMDPTNQIRHVVVMKGVQIGYTVGIAENHIGYLIDYVKNQPVIFATADQDLAKLRLDAYITPMIDASGLRHLIQSNDEKNSRKTGNTAKRVEWAGGGWLVPFGANNANRFTSISAPNLDRDEIERWPRVVGKDGDPIALSEARTNAFSAVRKILDGSTPSIEETSTILPLFNEGDRRRYFVRCMQCNYPQDIRWRREDPETGEVTGIVYELQHEGELVPGSVHYTCCKCGRPHSNDEKIILLDPAHGAEWKPTATPIAPWMRSYHIPGLLSPVGMHSWEDCVRDFLKGMDPRTGRVRSIEKLQVHYNNNLGVPFKMQGERVTFENVSPHRRSWHSYGKIPNQAAIEYCGSRVLLLVCSVDVHKDQLFVAIHGWCRDFRVLLIERRVLDGDTEDVEGEVWKKLEEVIERESWDSDDGYRYRVMMTFIDSGYRTDTVYQFCARYSAGVFPVKGRPIISTGAALREFSEFTTKLGKIGLWITVDIYKDRWGAALRRQWDGVTMQAPITYNAPSDITDEELKELTREKKVLRKDNLTGNVIGAEWHRPHGQPNELWDLLVYGNAALDVLAWDVCCNQWQKDAVNWADFWSWCELEKPYFQSCD